MKIHYFIVIGMLLMAAVVCGGDAEMKKDPKSDMYNVTKSAMDAGAMGVNANLKNPNVIDINWVIPDYDPKTYDYSAKLFSNHHDEILAEIPVTSNIYRTSMDAKPKGMGGGTYWLNLMRTVKGDEYAQYQYCERTGYPCEISKNLDMIRLDVGTLSKEYLDDSDEYEEFITGAIDRSKSPIKGAAWKNR